MRPITVCLTHSSSHGEAPCSVIPRAVVGALDPMVLLAAGKYNEAYKEIVKPRDHPMYDKAVEEPQLL